MPPPNRKPWPMKWVVVAIVAVVIPYTYLTLRYRRPEPAYEPYEEGKKRATTGKLLAAGFQRISLGALRTVDTARAASSPAVLTTTSGAGGLPAALKDSLVDQPLLATRIDRVAAGTSVPQAEPYRIEISCTLRDNTQQLSGATAYVKTGQLVIVPTFEKLGAGLLARSREEAIVVELPARSLKPGTYQASIVAAEGSRGWTLQVH